MKNEDLLRAMMEEQNEQVRQAFKEQGFTDAQIDHVTAWIDAHDETEWHKVEVAMMYAMRTVVLQMTGWKGKR